MFEKLFMLVKNNAGTAVIDNPAIPAKFHDAIINDASSSIIEVFKGQVESGKLKDMVKYFQFPGIYQDPLTARIVNKFANKLNNYYNLEPAAAQDVANDLIPKVMQQMIKRSEDKANDFDLGKMLSNLTGGLSNIATLLDDMAVA